MPARGRAALALAAVCSCSLLASSRAHGGDPPAPPPASSAPPATAEGDEIAAARAALEDLRPEDALALVRPRLESSSARQRAQALEITAIAHLVLGNLEEGKSAVRELYALAPGFALNDTSLPPRVTTVFEAEAAQAHPRGVTPSVRPRGAGPVDFEIPAGEATRLDLACRASPKAAYLPVSTRRAGRAHHFRLPTTATYWCWGVAYDADELPLGRLGSAAQPVEIRPRPPPIVASTPPLTGRWWFWTAIGVVAAGAATAAIVVATRPDDPLAPPADITVTAKRAGLSW